MKTLNVSLLIGMLLLGSCAPTQSISTRPATSSPNPNAPVTNTDFDLQKDRWRSILVPATPGTDSYSKDKLQQIDKAAQKQWDTINKAPDRSKLWNDLAAPAENDVTIPGNYNRILMMALAYQTPGSALYHNQELKKVILDALDWIYANYYNLTIKETGNWWSWEIGGPKALTHIMLLMEKDLSAQQIKNFTDVVFRFVSDPKVKASTGKSMETGANLMDKVIIFNQAALLARDEVKVKRAVEATSELFTYVTKGVGYYDDGSYIDHGVIAYTAGYGIVLLWNMARYLYVSQSSRWPVTDPNVGNVYRWAYESYEPTLYRGRILDFTAGRSISRGADSDLNRAVDVTTALLYLGHNAPAADAARLKSLAKYMIETDSSKTFYQKASLPALSLANRTLADVTSRGDVTFHKQFPGMDRVVHSRDGWMFAIAGSSNRVSNFETINEENLRGWYTGNGTVYFYNATSPNFSSDFWPTVDPYRLPGTTESSEATFPRSAVSVFGNFQYLSPRTWVGGAQVGDFGSFGMDFKEDGNRQTQGALKPDSTVSAKKSYFMFDNEIVMLGAGINATAGEGVQTTVENRQLGETNQTITVNGGAYKGGEQTAQAVQTLHISDVGGYVFLAPQPVNLKQEVRTGQWRDINASTAAGGTGWTRPDGVTPTTPVKKPYLTAWIDHGVNTVNGSYAYVQLPNATAAQTQAYQQNPDVTIIANTPDLQAVRENKLGITAGNFFAAGVAGGAVKVSAPAAVMVREQGGTLSLGLSDPTQQQTELTLEYQRPVTAVVSSNPAITVLQITPTLKLKVNLTDLRGKTVNLQATFNPAAPAVPLAGN